jgi:hypothetical protein
MATSRDLKRNAVCAFRRGSWYLTRVADTGAAIARGGPRVDLRYVTVASVFGIVAALAGAGPAAAQPVSISQAPPPSDEPSCSFTLSAPQLTVLPGGAKAATATYAASACVGNAQPVFATVCLESPSGKSQCFKNHGWLVSQVYLTTPPMSGEFTATGRGCWQAGSTIFTCVPSEPVRSTL